MIFNQLTLNEHTMNYILLVFIYINSIIIGYLIGRLHNNGVTNSSPQSFFSKLKDDKIVNNTIAIDDKKFVADIKTDGLERKYDSIGNIQQSKENISESVNKLKNLKR